MNHITKLLLTPNNFKPSFKDWIIQGVLNPAAIRLPNKNILLLIRIAESSKQSKNSLTCPLITSKSNFNIHYEKIPKKRILRSGKRVIFLTDGTCRLPTISHFKSVLVDKTGFKILKISNKMDFTGLPSNTEYGVEDPRITKIKNKYYMTYVGISLKEGVSTYLAESKNLKSWHRLGLIFREQNKDVVLFPQKIKGKFVALHRPETLFDFSRPSIWISYSPDLTYWGLEKSILKPRPNSWESDRIGSGPPPIKTKKGWLLFYHGVKNRKNINIYSVGSALLDLKNPEKVLARTPKNKPLLKPTQIYEKNGFMNNVIFPTGLVLDLNKKDLLIFSGGADRIVSVKKISISQVMKNMEFY